MFNQHSRKQVHVHPCLFSPPCVSADDRPALSVRDAGGARGARLPGPDAPGLGPAAAAPSHAVDQPGRAAHFHLPGQTMFSSDFVFLSSFDSSNSNLLESKVATYRHVYLAGPKEPTQFVSVFGSGIQNLPFSHSGMVSLYRSEPKEPT